MSNHPKTKKLFLLLVMFLAGTGRTFAGDYLLGDVNGDGRVNVADVDGIVGYILGRGAVGFNQKAANVNGDNRINIADADGVINVILTKTVARNGVSTLVFAETTIEKEYGDAPFSVDTYRAGSTGAISFASDATDVVAVDASTGVMTVTGGGTATITATLAADGGLSAATATLTVTVTGMPDNVNGSGTINPWEEGNSDEEQEEEEITVGN